jgi:hypothetical protein
VISSLVHSDRIEEIRDLATSLYEAMESLGCIIQQHTEIICPECKTVCCIDRHSFHSFEDIVYIFALGEKLPQHLFGMEDFLPCRFLGKNGCTISRHLRPYRCSWYFCSPLLEHIGQLPIRDYRRFISLLQDITCRRQNLIQKFNSLEQYRAEI